MGLGTHRADWGNDRALRSTHRGALENGRALGKMVTWFGGMTAQFGGMAGHSEKWLRSLGEWPTMGWIVRRSCPPNIREFCLLVIRKYDEVQRKS